MEIEPLKNKLIESTALVVSKKGLANVTTKAICQKAHCNEAYIYRLFGGKTELLRAAFERLDKELAHCIEYGIKKNHEATIEEDFANIFSLVWEFLLEKKDWTSFVIRYYHSAYYTDEYDAYRKVVYEKVLAWMSLYIKDNCDVWWLLNQIYDLLFNTLGRLLRSGTENDLKERERAKELILHVICPFEKID